MIVASGLGNDRSAGQCFRSLVCLAKRNLTRIRNLGTPHATRGAARFWPRSDIRKYDGGYVHREASAATPPR